MAIHTPNLAPLNFGRDRRPRVRAVDEVVDLQSLLRRINMIELEHHGIGLSAIHARVLRQVPPDSEP